MPAGRVRAGLRILQVRGSEREQPRDVPRQRYEAAIAASLDRAPARRYENTVVSYQPTSCFDRLGDTSNDLHPSSDGTRVVASGARRVTESIMLAAARALGAIHLP